MIALGSFFAGFVVAWILVHVAITLWGGPRW